MDVTAESKASDKLESKLESKLEWTTPEVIELPLVEGTLSGVSVNDTESADSQPMVS